MDFTKVQSVGNDFVLIETSDNKRNWSDVAQAICNRHFGVGADGLLLLMPSDKADFRMRIFNTDGSEAEACGNGLRCLVHYISSKGLSSAKNLAIETFGGTRKAEILRDSNHTRIRIGMGAPIFEPSLIPVQTELGKGGLVCGMTVNYPLLINGDSLKLGFISMGNPHALYFTDKAVADFPLAEIGPRVETSAMFPKKTNFEVARVINSRSIEMRVWERGVGETLACGSGACAVAVAAWILGFTGDKVDIKLPGGKLSAEWSGQGDVYLTGEAEIVFTGCWSK
ncbi:diaminopimelate epimerase [Dehalogenimonas etheniformans]|uniref:Diaminopimelate epimerase n=1 Tax=Dehalogenimonas etheniformans TaxID=1536648 RepID=A0A2P5P9G8_9CHLR|nr:diaminopimelate epimerase [Dehalogenimonas etheniformans]PPD58949.1 diaminopimelate epimerase [Dehalogenimonas etheniformans]QNT76282.1 diaminopimelate epimerase [Dehalogenimonas etheniformans]